MKLVLIHYSSDGCTYNCTNTHPIERESPEALLCELEDWARNENVAINSYDGWNDTDISWQCALGEDKYDSFEILTLDKWFENNKVG